MIEELFAAAVLLVCAALLLRLGLGPARRQRWDRYWRGLFERSRRLGRWTRRQWLLLRSRSGARREAGRAIRRARGDATDVEHDGNVIRPRKFRKSEPKKPPLH